MSKQDLAVQCLKKLDIYEPYIIRFADDSTPCLFERFAGFYVYCEEKLLAKIKEIQNEFDCLVYAVTHEYFDFGECWSMCCVSKSTTTVEDCLVDTPKPDIFYSFAYVWNETNPDLSEFGDIAIRSCAGGIRRIG